MAQRTIQTVYKHEVGGDKGGAFNDNDVALNGDISRIDVWYGEAIDAIQCSYNGKPGKKHGGGGKGGPVSFIIPKDYRLTGMETWIGPQIVYGGKPIALKGIRFTTSPKSGIGREITSDLIGHDKGEYEVFSYPPYQITSISGSSGVIVDKLIFNFGYLSKDKRFPFNERRDLSSVTDHERPHISEFTKTWMSNIKDTVPLNRISIPGTHESATSTYTGGIAPLWDHIWVQCQKWNLYEQLSAGIRSFDFRLYRWAEEFRLWHGPEYLNVSLYDALNTIDVFLKANPSETVIVNIAINLNPFLTPDEKSSHKEERRYKSGDLLAAPEFGPLWAKVAKKYKELFYGKKLGVSDSIPILKDLRGKVLLINNVEDNALGVGIPYGYQSIVKQKNYWDIGDAAGKVSVDKKKKEIKRLFYRAAAKKSVGKKEVWVFNDLSGNGYQDRNYTPFKIAQATNPYAMEIMRGLGYGYDMNFGVVNADYPGNGLIWRIIRSNFAPLPY